MVNKVVYKEISNIIVNFEFLVIVSNWTVFVFD